MAPIDIRPDEFAEKDIMRFWSKVEIRGHDECWPWTSGKANYGYGLFGIGGRKNHRKHRAHRVAYALEHGSLSAESVVRHKCDYTGCCNPAHLQLGTKADNSRDMVMRGRSSKGGRHGTPILTAENVINMRKRAKQGERVKPLAEEFSVHERTARLAISGQTWKSVDSLESPRIWRK